MINKIAESDERVRAVLLNGSRVNSKIVKDKFQDFDIVFIIRNIDSFLKDPTWVDVFGERLIMQMPDNMNLGDNFQIQSISFAYLMLFEDGNRIDLTLFSIEKFKTEFQLDSLTKVLLDKDGLFNNLAVSSDKDYWIKRPTEKEFLDRCNEFWWVSTYVAKGLVRKEITYAKAMMDGPVRNMFMKVLEWHIGIKTNFSVSFGKEGRFIQQNVTHEMYKKILATYPDFEIESIWDSLFIMTSLFVELSNEVQSHMNFQAGDEGSAKVISYLHKVRESSGK
jgi:aminoglycoside 6-adenylyltransferase